MEVEETVCEVKYDRRAEILSVRLREGEPKYVSVGRGFLVVYADDDGVWAVEFEAESWDSDEALRAHDY